MQCKSRLIISTGRKQSVVCPIVAIRGDGWLVCACGTGKVEQKHIIAHTGSIIIMIASIFSCHGPITWASQHVMRCPLSLTPRHLSNSQFQLIKQSTGQSLRGQQPVAPLQNCSLALLFLIKLEPLRREKFAHKFCLRRERYYSNNLTFASSPSAALLCARVLLMQPVCALAAKVMGQGERETASLPAFAAYLHPR